MYDRMGFGANFHDKIISANSWCLGFVSTVFWCDFCVFWSMYGEHKEMNVCSATHQDIYIVYVLVTLGEVHHTLHSTIYTS